MKINRVFLGTCEPSYFVREKGYEVLREAGIEVYIVDETGVAQGSTCARISGTKYAPVVRWDGYDKSRAERSVKQKMNNTSYIYL